ncbi:hypothetical protein RRF57_012500 [Xylaria bambusicola]|uniref:Uncharacterized protein n=1 Tax=Xylaria bambusicola TaxID=326684 RepID=A0AAN7ZEW4_9PEZI
MEGQYSFPENWALPAPSVTEEDRAPQQEEDGGSYTSAQKTFLMDGPELIDATILKVTLERMWGPEGKGYFIGFSRKEQTYFILALPSFNVDIVRAIYSRPQLTV